MLSIRFKRIGRKKMPIYRIVLMEKHKDPWGDYKEKLGFYNPHTKETNLNAERIKYWISVGAQPSNTVANLLIKNGVIAGDKKKSIKISKKRSVKLQEVAEKAKEEQIKKDASSAENESESKSDSTVTEDNADNSETNEVATSEEVKAKEVSTTPVVEGQNKEENSNSQSEEKEKLSTSQSEDSETVKNKEAEPSVDKEDSKEVKEDKKTE